MKEDKKRLSKQTIALIIIAVLIIVLVAVICIGSAKTKNDSKYETTSAVSTTATVNSSNSSSTYKYVDDEGNDITPHMSKDGKRMMEGDHLGTFEGMAWSTINGKKGLYYFNGATYDPTFTGLADGPNRKYYYVKKGKWDPSFTGFISRADYLRYVKNGIEQNFNGTFYLDEYDTEGNPIKNGAVYGFEMGRPDNWQFPLHKWHVEPN